MPEKFTSGRAAADFILSEANGHRSRGNVTLLAGQVVAAGTVLGKVTASGKYKAVTAGAADGSQTASAVSIYAVDATSADVQIAVIERDAEVNGKLLSYGADIDTAGERTAVADALKAVGIIAR